MNTVLLMKSEAACGRCPFNLVCMTLRPLTNVTFCRRCGAISFKRKGERYLCMLIRDGIHSRLKNTVWQQKALMSDHDKRIAYVLAAVANKHAEYEGCSRLRTKEPSWQHRRRERKNNPEQLIGELSRQTARWNDCVHYFREVANGFDREF